MERDLYDLRKRNDVPRNSQAKDSLRVKITPSMPLCPLMFQGLNKQQKDFIEKQWTEQKEQFLGRQKSMYNNLEFALKRKLSETKYMKIAGVQGKTSLR